MKIQTWAKQLIDIYNKSETEDVYNRRRNNEIKNIKRVIESIKSGYFDLTSTDNKAAVIHMLKAADSITLVAGRNYLDEFLRIPSVKQIIENRLNPDAIKKVTQKAIDNEKTGNVPSFPLTASEKDKIRANKYLSTSTMLITKSPSEEIKYFQNYIKTIEDGKFTIKTNANDLKDISTIEEGMVRLGRVLSRQEGNNPGKPSIEQGNIIFELDVPEKSDIFHGLRQKQGISIAQAEEKKRKQEEQERYNKEQERLNKEKKVRISEYNEKVTTSNKNEKTKLDDARQAYLKQMKKISDKKSQGVDYKSKIDSFRKTLQKDQNGNTIRINNNIAIQQSESRRAKSKGMEMDR